jgi:hypothetical protein
MQRTLTLRCLGCYIYDGIDEWIRDTFSTWLTNKSGSVYIHLTNGQFEYALLHSIETAKSLSEAEIGSLIDYTTETFRKDVEGSLVFTLSTLVEITLTFKKDVVKTA